MKQLVKCAINQIRWRPHSSGGSQIKTLVSIPEWDRRLFRSPDGVRTTGPRKTHLRPAWPTPCFCCCAIVTHGNMCEIHTFHSAVFKISASSVDSFYDYRNLTTVQICASVDLNRLHPPFIMQLPPLKLWGFEEVRMLLNCVLVSLLTAQQ